MKTLLSFTFTLILISILSFQNASATVTKTVGATGGYYSTLKAAFDDINYGTITGDIVLQIIDNTTETASAVLYQSGYTGTGGTSNYTSILIYPTVTGKCISGTISQGAVIVLDGATNVTIDGRLNATGSTTDLEITNFSTDASSGTSTIMFTGTSQYAGSDFIKYCKIKGSETDPSSGVIFFSTAASTHGNNNNSIFNNEITCSSAGRPINAIYSYGNGSYINTADTISNNNIHDFINPNNSSCGIYLSQYTEGWTISGNSFYETASFTPGADVEYDAIIIDNSSAANTPFTVTGNYIGGSSPNCGSSGSVSSWTKTNDYDNIFTGIYLNLNPGFSTASGVQNNIIQNFNWSNSVNASWTGIYVVQGYVDLGTNVGNTIGATTGTGSVTVTGTTTGLNVFGIYISSKATVNCKNNLIGSISAVNTSTEAGNIYGIYEAATAGTMNISNNTIGSSTTSGSINASSTSSTSGNIQDVVGIYTAGSGTITIDNNIVANMINGTTNTDGSTPGLIDGISCNDALNSGTVIITNNNIHDLTIANANSATDFTGSICGIALSATSTKTLSGNTIYNLSNNYASFTGNVTGLYFTSSSSAATVQTSFIHDLSVNSSSAGASIYGILISAGKTTYYNNIISITASTQTTIYGIYETGATNNNNSLYFNTIYIAGSPSAGSYNSYALYSAGTANQRDFQNNLLYNAQSSSGATGTYYAAYLNWASTIRLTNLDYNDYFTPGTGGVLGNYGGTDVKKLPLILTFDGHSLNTDPVLVSAGGTGILDYTPTVSLNGISMSITTDYTGNTRASTPTMGALEKNASFNVEVWKSGVLQSGYFTLRDAFNKVNDGTHTGSLIVKIKKNTIEKNSAILNSSGTGSASYSAIIVYPTATGITESGSFDAPLIELNGANYVTIDGRVNGTGSAIDMVITNSSTSTTAASTILFVNSAGNNTVQYCTIKGSETGTATGVIYFSQSITGTGNNNNTIVNNNITSDPAGRPIYAIYSQGASGYLNSGDAINNNSFYNFLSQGKGSYGIYLGSYSSNFTISGNSFYETTSFIPTAGVEYDIIDIYNTSGVGFNVTGNYIGGSAASCGGTAWTKTNAISNVFVGILVNAGTSSSSSIQNNTIQNFSWSNNSSSTWTGISVTGGTVNIGTSIGNTIGATTGTGSVTVTGATTGMSVYGIYIASSVTVNCKSNLIGSITAANASSNASNIYGIYEEATAGTMNISNNTIGSSTTAGSIKATSPSSTSGNNQDVIGIYTSGSGIITIDNNIIANMINGTTNSDVSTTGLIDGISCDDVTNSGTVNITNNNIHDLTIANANSATDFTGSICGIALSATSTKTLSGNTIYNLSNNYASFTGNVTGLYFTSSSSAATVQTSFIHDLSVNSSSAGASIYGILISAGKTTYYNNILYLGGTTTTNIIGIYDPGTTGNNSNIYFNTIYIGGSVSSGSNNSIALYSNNNSSISNYGNNIFVNARSTTGGSNLHYAIYLNYSTSSNLTLDYNDYYVTGTGGTLGYYSATNQTSLPVVTGKDAHSKSIDPIFTSAGGTVATNYHMGSNLVATPIGGITTDYGANTRSVYFPAMGAWEDMNKWKGNLSTDWNTAGNWTGINVPAADADVIFDDAPVNHCIADQNRYVGSIYNAQATYRTVTNGHHLRIKGSLVFTNGAQIDASATSSAVEFAGSNGAQSIPSGAFYNNQVYDLVINNSANVVLNGTLSLLDNITTTSGLLDATTQSPTFDYAGTSAQTIGSASPFTNPFTSSTVYNLTIDNTSGVTQECSALTVSNTFTINSGALFQIAPENLLTVSGTFTNNAGTGGFVILSDATGTGNLISGTTGVNGTVQRYMAGGSSLPYHYVSPPINNAPFSDIYSPGDKNLMTYDETVVDPDLDEGWVRIISGTLNVCQGYAAVCQNPSITRSFAGIMNAASTTVNVTFTATTMPGGGWPHSGLDPRGWNLIGNPFPCALTITGSNGFLNSANSAKLDASATAAYFWDDHSGNRARVDYSSYNNIGGTSTSSSSGAAGPPGNFIPVAQGFFVKLTDAYSGSSYSTTLAFSSNQKTANSSSQYFIPDPNTTKRIWIDVANDSNGLFNEILIGFLPGATKGIDPGLDAIKLKGNPNISLYSIVGDKDLIIQGLPPITDQTVVPLGLDVLNAGKLTLYVNRKENFTDEQIYLRDSLENKLIDLNVDTFYTFSIDTGSTTNRFELIFAPYFSSIQPGGQKGNKSPDPIVVYSGGKNIFINNPTNTDLMVQVYDLLGKKIEERKISGSGLNTISISGSQGYYLVKVNGANTNFAKKVFVNN